MKLPLSFIALLAGLLVVAVLSAWKLLRERQRIKQLGDRAPVVTPWWSLGLPFIWEVLQYGLMDENLKFFHNYFFASTGSTAYKTTLEARMAGTRYIFTADPKNVKAVLSSQFSDFGKGERFRRDWKDLMGTSIFGADGKLWQEERSLMGSVLNGARVGDMSVFEPHLQKLIPKIGTGHAVNVKDYFLRLTLDIMSEFSLGVALDAINNPNLRFSQAFESALRTQSLIERMGPLNFLIPRRQFLEHIRWTREHVRPIVEAALALSPEELDRVNRKDKGFTFLHGAVVFTRDVNILTDQILTILFAGRDSSGLTLTWLFFELSRQPEFVAELRQEIREHVGFDRPPKYQELKKMKLVQATLKEILRLYPVAPLNNRIALRDTTLPSGGGPNRSQPIGVPEGTTVTYSIHMIQLNEDHYPKNDEKFVPLHKFYPKRFLDWTPQPWTWMPFNGGPRVCIGQDFAMTQMGYILVRLFQEFSRIELDESVQTVEETGVTGHPWRRWRQDKPSEIEAFIQNTPTMSSEILLIPKDPLMIRFIR